MTRNTKKTDIFSFGTKTDQISVPNAGLADIYIGNILTEMEPHK